MPKYVYTYAHTKLRFSGLLTYVINHTTMKYIFINIYCKILTKEINNKKEKVGKTNLR